MTELETAVLNEGLGVSDANNIGTLEHMDVDTFEFVQKIIENVVETINFDKEPSNNVDKLVDITPDDSNDIAEPSEVNKVQKKRHVLIDSDAEDEQHEDLDTSDKENDKEESIQIKVQKKRITLLDSDSDDEQNVINREINENVEAQDSEKENEKPQNKQVQKKKSRLVKMYDSDSNDSTEFRLQIKVIDEIDHVQSSRLKMLCDSESSADETEQNDHPDSAKENQENIQLKLKPRKSKKNSELDDKKNKMTGREALEQRRQIKSESQRMVRESRVSLPYHRPKSHTLQEFLQRRSRVGDVIIVPPNTPTTFAIKMSSEQLALTAKRLAEREKEIEEFYKSDTDSEPEEEDKPVEDKTDTEKPENQEARKSNENQYLVESTEPVNDPDSVVNTETSTENSGENMDTNEPVNKDAIALLEQSNNSQENDTTQTVHNEEQTELICDKHDELPEEATKNVQEPNERQDEDDDAAREEKIKELYQVLEKFINNGSDSKAQNNISDHTSDESVQMDIIEKENTTTEDSTSNNNQTDNSKSKKELLEATKAAETMVEQRLKRLNPLVSLKGNFQPRLSTGPNDLVVLDDGIEQSKGVNDLMKRFLTHTAKKTVHKKTDVSIVSVVGGVVHQETIHLVDDEKTEERAKTAQTPGAQFKKLREELEHQMARKREEEWKKRQEQKRLDNEEDLVYNGEKTECGMAEPAILFDEEEEMTVSESSEEEDDNEEDDVEIKEKPRTKSAFVDDEAEQSDDVEDAADEEEDSDEEDDDNEEQIDELKEDGVKKPLKRIITAFSDDSDEDTNNTESEAADRQRTTSATTTTDMFASQPAGKPNCWDDDDDDITLYQPQNSLEKTPSRNLTQNKPDLSFLTPTLHLTGLQGMPSTPHIQESPVINLSLPPEPSPLRSHPGLKTKLFDDTEPADFDTNLNELEGLCSGKFTGSAVSEMRSKKNLTAEEAELLAVCSGRFTGLTGHVSSEPKSTEGQEESSLGIAMFNDDSQEMQLTFNDDDIMKGTKTQDTSNQTLTIETERDIEERDIDEVADKKLTQRENELIQECCSDKKETTCQVSSKSMNSSRPKFVIASSSDEEAMADVSSPKKKQLKKKRKKYIIDDISVTDDEDFEDREDDDFEDNEGTNEDIDARNVGYDSEENEIDLDAIEREDTVVDMKKARDFFDAEAELSGSDWGSADEDEKDLDDFEIEDGDMEKINEKKMQQELGKIHARQVLDDDKREVRLLQELLLEDGEMHGTGRERKFRWKNADSLIWNTNDKPKDDDEDCEEIEESEYQWRKMRHERETFLKEQQLKMNKTDTDDTDLLGKNSQIMQFGHAALKKSISGVESQEKLLLKRSRHVTRSPDVHLPFALVNQRGSFLARSETTLARLAEITQTTNGVLNNGPKKSRNFVFTSVEKPETTNPKKRKAEEGTPKILKKLRIADMSPNVSKLKRKLLPQKLNMQ